jgi:hypothetical protein
MWKILALAWTPILAVLLMLIVAFAATGWFALRQRAMLAEREARFEAERARMEAEDAMRAAEEARLRAEKALKDKPAVDKDP